MMNIEKYADDTAAYLKETSFFSDKKIIRAYSDKVYSGEVKEMLVAVGIESAELTPCEIGYGAKSAEIKVFADIYTPESEGNKAAMEALEELCEAIGENDDYNIASISSEKTKYESSGALVTRTTVTFNTGYSDGGESGE